MLSKQKALLRRLNKFFQTESSGGILMIATAVFALFMANGSSAQWYHDFIHMQLTIDFGEKIVTQPLSHLVKDGLMVLFFLLVGMELKREMLDGFLSDRKQILLPLLAAIGGMVAPAIIFLLVNYSIPQNLNGWAIPSATDIAFAICILTLAGKHIPPALKIFLLAIAIFDDLGAILIIAFFYSSGIALNPLLFAIVCVVILFVLNKIKIMLLFTYLVIGAGLCYFLHHAGIHTTIGGVITALAVPMRNPKNENHSPLNKLMHSLHPLVTFFILPVFAFTTAGVNLHGVGLESLLEPLALGVALGLFLGKQLGIFATTWLMVKTKIAALPDGVSWSQIYGMSLVAGIGFTMSLFMGVLAFDNAIMQEQVKLGVLAGSLLAAICGWLVLRMSPQLTQKN